MEQTDKERQQNEAEKYCLKVEHYDRLDGIVSEPWENTLNAFLAGATHEHETQVIPLREKLEELSGEADSLVNLLLTNRERLEKVEKALKEARDVLVMASLIDKTSTCMDAVNEIDQLLTKEG